MQRRTRLLFGLVTLCFVAVAAWITSPAALLNRIDLLAGRPLAFGAAVIMLAAVRPALAWPTSLLSVAVGYAYGLAGIPFALFLLTLTSLPPYWFGLQTSGTGRISTAGIELTAATGDVRGLAAIRLLPLPSDLISVGAGVARMRRRPYLVGTALGELPWAVLGVVVGLSLDQLHHGRLDGGVDPWIFVAMAAGSVLLLAGPCYRLLRRTRMSSSPDRTGESPD